MFRSDNKVQRFDSFAGVHVGAVLSISVFLFMCNLYIRVRFTSLISTLPAACIIILYTPRSKVPVIL